MSSYRMTAKMDNKGRLLLPRKLRDSLRLSSGDTLFLQFESESGIVRLAKASSPFDVLADEAEKELECIFRRDSSTRSGASLPLIR